MESGFFSNTSGILYSLYKVSYNKTIASLTHPKDLHVNRLHKKPIIQSIYEHISAPIRSMIYIIDNIYLGNAYNASNYSYLMDNNIRCIVNATDEIENYFEYDNKFTYMKLNGVIDNSKGTIKSYFDDFIQFMTENKNSNILIHCYMGSSRSATLIVLYLIYFKMYSLDDAIKFIENKCNRVNINTNYIEELKIYSKIKII